MTIKIFFYQKNRKNASELEIVSKGDIRHYEGEFHKKSAKSKFCGFYGLGSSDSCMSLRRFIC